MNYKRGDFYTKKAKKEGYKARSVYKLQEIAKKYPILKGVKKVLDLGAAPGSWTQFLLQKQKWVVAIDIQPLAIKPHKQLHFIQKDVTELDESFLSTLGKFDLVLSDMAPKTTGIKHLDQQRSLMLSETALWIAQQLLNPKGHFVCKIFESADTQNFFKAVQSTFQKAYRFKPRSSRKNSKEFFIIGLYAYQTAS